MAKKERNPTADLAVYIVLRAVVAVLQALPLRVALGFGRVLGWLAYTLDKRHRKVARENLTHAFPELSAAAVEDLVRGCFRHFGTMLVEIVCLPRRIHVHNWRSYGTPENLGGLLQHMLQPRSTMIVTAHFGNWEVAGYILGMVGFRTYAIARELDNPHLHRFLNNFRQKTGQRILDKEKDYERITEALVTNQVVATLGDQDAGAKGLFVDFFNRPASTHKAVAMLAMYHDVPMVVIGIPRIGYPMKYAVIVEDVIDPNEYRGQPDAIKAMTIRFTQAIERLVRRYPEQYFWLHRRWKHQPPARKPKG